MRALGIAIPEGDCAGIAGVRVGLGNVDRSIDGRHGGGCRERTKVKEVKCKVEWEVVCPTRPCAVGWDGYSIKSGWRGR